MKIVKNSKKIDLKCLKLTHLKASKEELNCIFILENLQIDSFMNIFIWVVALEVLPAALTFFDIAYIWLFFRHFFSFYCQTIIFFLGAMLREIVISEKKRTAWESQRGVGAGHTLYLYNFFDVLNRATPHTLSSVSCPLTGYVSLHP